MFALPYLITALGGIVMRILGSSVVRFLAIKILAWTSLTVILPLMLWKVWMKVQVYMLERVMGSLAEYAGTINPAVIELTGIGAYIADHLMLAEGVSVLLGGALIAYSMKLVKR